MERHEVLEMMAALKLAGMRAAFDELLADGLKRQHPVQRIIGELLKAEIVDKQARSIKYQMSVAKLPLAKELADFDFTDTPVNEPLVRELAAGGFLANLRHWPDRPLGQVWSETQVRNAIDLAWQEGFHRPAPSTMRWPPSAAVNAYGLKLPSTVSTAAIAPSRQFEGRLDWPAAQASNPTVRSSHANQSHFPHRRPRHPA